jgi:fluoride ion exporter CrcB/FEX
MSHLSDIELADTLSRRRARASAGLAIVFIATQGGSLSNGRANGHLDIPFILWALVLLVILFFGGGWWRGAAVRDAMNDETTKAHRRAAMAAGFVIGLIGAFIIYGLTFYEEVTAREAVRLLITMGVAGALLRFSTLERRALGQ